MQDIHLFSPFSIRSVSFRNRIGMSPMCQYSSQDGFANEWHRVHLGSRAVGGCGLIMTEATAITPEGRISPQDLGLWKDEHIDFLSLINQFVLEHGAIPGIQLAHAGRKASTKAPWVEGNHVATRENGGWHPVGPSPIPFAEGYPVPRELSVAEIKLIPDLFAKSAERALKANYKVIEIHSAHGYLLHEFLSPLSNRRNDEYGGSLQNRMRLLCEVIEAVRAAIGHEIPLIVRISVTDWVEGGWDLPSSLILCKHAKELGADLIDCSSGGTVFHTFIPVGSGYQTGFSADIKREVGIATSAIGLITSASQADHIIRTGQADMVFIGRELLRNPYFPLEAAHLLGYKIEWPKQYQRAEF